MNNRRVGRSPVAAFSPGSQNSPSAFSTPSQKYASRSGRGEVVCSFPTTVEGSLLNNNWREHREIPLSVKVYEEHDALVTPYKFMFQKSADKAYVLNDMIFEMGEKLKEVRVTSAYSHVGLPMQEPVTVVGRVCCDGNGRLNANSLLLEGSMDSSSGRRVPLDVSNVPQFSLFPGQIVAMDGVNGSGRRFVANKIHEGVLPSSPTNALTISDGLSVVVAAGPFSTSDNILYEPLVDLMSCLDGGCPPDVCILLGPFVDAKHTVLEKGDIGMTYSELFDQIVSPLLQLAGQQDIELVLVPSYRDLHHLCVYPQPPFLLSSSRKMSKVHWVSDPCTLDIGGVIIGLSSTDILFHLGAEEISGCQQQTQMTDRISRLVQHILTQQNYYPLYPPHPDVPVDVEHFFVHCQLPIAPHLMILPSDLRCFIKEVGSTVCVNPGRMAKGQVGGTYAKVSISRRADSVDNETALPLIVGQIVRI